MTYLPQGGVKRTMCLYHCVYIFALLILANMRQGIIKYVLNNDAEGTLFSFGVIDIRRNICAGNIALQRGRLYLLPVYLLSAGV